jgi:hypothetical protein
MGEGESTEWPDDNTDPFGDVESEDTPSLEKESEDLVKPEDEFKAAVEESEDSGEDPEENFEATDETSEWSLPIRAAPLLQQFHNEKVTEYPLQQSDDGRKATSLVLDDDLLRIIESRLDDDGQRRLKVSLSMKREITGFKHQHNELMHNHQFLWLGMFISGIVLLLLPPTIINFIGVILVTLSIWCGSLMHLETHRLEFSNSGGVHVHTLHGYGTNRPFFRASMALLGSEMAGLLRNGVLETETLDQLHLSLATPAPAPAPALAPAPTPMPTQTPQAPIQPQILVSPISIPPPPMQIPAPPQVIPVETPPMPGPPVALAPLPAPLPLPTAPTPLPPLAPLPPLGAAAGMPLPAPFGLPGAPMPLDAPLPNAPEIAVVASPVEDTLSEKEQSALLSELS